MADKQATVYLIDVGKLSQVSYEDCEPEIDTYKKFIEQVVGSKILSKRKTDLVSVVLYKKDGGTNEDLNISVISPIKLFTLNDLKDVLELLEPGNVSYGLLFESINFAVDMLSDYCKQLKWVKTIVVLTGCEGSIDQYNMQDTIEKLNKHDIRVTIMVNRLDESSVNLYFKNKSESKISNENLLSTEFIPELKMGNIVSLQLIMKYIESITLKKIRPVSSYRGYLFIGKPGILDDKATIKIAVERFPCIKKASPPGTTLFSHSNSDSKELQQVKTYHSYFITDEKEPDGKLDVEQNTLLKSFVYGDTIIPFTEDELQLFELDFLPEISIIGFVSEKTFPRYQLMEETFLIVAERCSNSNSYALSSLIQALKNTGRIALARFVRKAKGQVEIIALIPYIGRDIEALIESRLPFAEDVRHFKFPILDKVIPKNENESKTENKFIPTEEQTEAMRNYINESNLSFKEDFGFSQIPNPLIKRINQAILKRALNPSEPDLTSSETSDILSSPLFSSLIIPESQEEQEELITNLKNQFKLEKIEPKSNFKKRKLDEISGSETESAKNLLSIDDILDDVNY